jgi:Zn-dependent protease
MSLASPDPQAIQLPRIAWRANLALFVATLASMFVTSFDPSGGAATRAVRVTSALQFTGTLIAILLAHEFGHFIAARIHKVDASLPYFLPLPILSPFGTMGAVIRMRGAIPTRRALLDIGASGPLAGLVVAIPSYIWGVSHSTVVPLDGEAGGLSLGESIFLKTADHFFGPATPEGMQISLSPVAFAAWAGMFVTMLNLIPIGQLDGGHVAYSLFGPRQNNYATTAHRAMLAFFFVSLGQLVFRDLQNGAGLSFLGRNIQNSMSWLIWFEGLAILASLSSEKKVRATDVSLRTRLVAILGLATVAGIARDEKSLPISLVWLGCLGVLLAMEAHGGVLRKHALLVHPPTGDDRLGPIRTVIAVVSLAFFVFLFMPTPMSF